MWDLIHVGSHVGDYHTDKFFHTLSSNSKVIFVEPVAALFEKLIHNCNKYYPENNFIHLNCAISNKNGTLTLYTPDVEIFSDAVLQMYIERELVNWVDQLTSVHKNHIRDHYINVPPKELVVKCITLNSLIEQYNITSLDTLYIDTEGHDYEVLEGLDLDKLKPKRIVFEHKHMEGTNMKPGKRYRTLLAKLFSYGYNLVSFTSEDTEVCLQED